MEDVLDLYEKEYDPERPEVCFGETSKQLVRPKEEMARLGDEIYERDIRHQVERDHRGEIVAIDVDSGRYVIAESVVTSWKCLVTQHTEGNFWFMRVGYPTVYHLGGCPPGRAS